jgi:hypothetical protein
MRRKRFLMTKGERNGRLEALQFVERDPSGQQRWLFRCDCGQTVIVRVGAVRSANTVSCGCQKIESATLHGMSRSPEYRAWRAMIDRCDNPKNKSFHNYGGRGIKVAIRWRSFQNFIADMGPRPPGLTLERLNNDRSYSKGNCEWASWTAQARNRRKQTKRAR